MEDFTVRTALISAATTSDIQAFIKTTVNRYVGAWQTGDYVSICNGTECIDMAWQPYNTDFKPFPNQYTKLPLPYPDNRRSYRNDLSMDYPLTPGFGEGVFSWWSISVGWDSPSAGDGRVGSVILGDLIFIGYGASGGEGGGGFGHVDDWANP